MATIFLIALTALLWLLEITTAPEEGAHGVLLYNMVLALSAICAVRLVEIFVGALTLGGHASKATTDRLRAMTSILLYATAGLGWLRFGMGVDVSGLLATSAVFSVIIGFALQATLGNLFSGLSLELERPLKVGDYLLKGQIEGRVEALKWRSLFIRTSRNTRIVLPNSALTGDAVEVIDKTRPSLVTIPFTVSASVPPMKVQAVGMQVLTSGLPDVCRDPAPSILVLGTEPYTGCLRYGARFYSLAFLDRTAVGSAVFVRLWCALSRQDIVVSPPGASHDFVVEDGEVIALSSPGKTMQQACLTALVPGHLPRDIFQRLRSKGRRLHYGPGEQIDLEGGAAVVLSGSAREESPGGEQDVSEALTQLRAAPLALDAPPIVSVRLMMETAERAANVIGPIAHTLAARYGALTDDPFVLSRALAEHIPDVRDRAHFLRESPECPSRRLAPGALFGWAALLGLEPVGQRLPVSNNAVEILRLTADEVREVLSGLDDALFFLMAAEPGLRGLSAPVLEQWLRT
ncbi:MAG TPA: mechanosensitive ion channel domain-containing protein [Telmatospirillum sp.]|nr:mechanosensitive ion channel domain-containing protein [Telmatospirillum sp.]